MTEKKIRNTPQRQLVLKIVKESMDHPCAEMVYTRARELDPTISLGTVYRNLNMLSEMGDIVDLSMPSGPDHYDFNTAPHSHFYCKSCGCVTDVKHFELSEELSLTMAESGYKIEGYNLVFTGLCPKCIKKQ